MRRVRTGAAIGKAYDSREMISEGTVGVNPCSSYTTRRPSFTTGVPLPVTVAFVMKFQ